MTINHIMKITGKMNAISCALVAVTSLALTAVSPGATLITGTTIESSTVGLNADMGPEKAISGAGLPGDVPSLTGSHRLETNSNWWTGWSGDVTEWQLTVDLEDSYDVEVIQIWNFREGCCTGRGLSNVEIFVSPDDNEANLVKLITDGFGTHDDGGGFLFPEASTDAEYLGFSLDLSGVTNSELLSNARLVRIDGGSFNHNGGSDHGGLAEIQFGSRVPEPASATLGLLGIVGFMMRRRRNA